MLACFSQGFLPEGIEISRFGALRFVGFELLEGQIEEHKFSRVEFHFLLSSQ
jgi:hypothetical protein